ncbi:MAG: NAD(P)H-hydrate dehydratase [Candidatus Izimaplasma sp.]|nr:NAD(P)H-hydrate dehydratase [Candidatus Izimaplasma bacterium]
MNNYRIVNVNEMRFMDEYTCTQLDMSSLDLMKQAGGVIYLSIIEDIGIDKANDQILIVAGTGNNGGDALVVGVNLLDNGYKVKIVILGDLTAQTKESKIMLKEIVNYKVDVLFINNKTKLPELSKLLRQSTLLVDGIFGIGLIRDVEGIYYDVIKLINLNSVDVVSIDIPSGINANNGLIAKVAIKADYTLIVQNYKVGNLINDAVDYHGTKVLLDIGILKVVCKSRRFLLEKEDYQNSLPERVNNTHKYHYGNLLTIGGSKGMMGAPLLAAYAALRTGSGLSSIAYREKYLHNIFNIYPEVMTSTYNSSTELLDFTNKKNTIIFGPGLGRNDEDNLDILRNLLKLGVPMVIDADGLYYLKQLFNEFKSLKNVVITPHYGEMAMLLDTDTINIQKNPLEHIKTVTEKYRLSVVLKGTTTIIANKNSMYFSNYGNPGMATAGSGDVLSGIIGSLIGKGTKLIEACRLGVLIHSMAGELAFEELGEEAIIATDIIKYIPAVLKELKE